MLTIGDGSEIGIIGGGPAGSLFAKFACDYAHQKGIDVNVTIYSNRHFSEAGPKGCKGCVGVINERLNKKLKDIGITLPEELIMQTIDGYSFITKGGHLHLKKKTYIDSIVTVFRGNGPLCFPLKGFDGFLLEQAQKSGAKIIQSQVRDVIFPESKEDKVIIKHDYGFDEVDLLVGAFGVRSPIIRRFKKMGYSPPDTTKACLVELECDVKQNTIYILSLGIPNIDYAIMIPKKRFLTLGIIGKNVHLKELSKFLSLPVIAEMLPEKPKVCCRCCTSIPIANPRKPFGDRVIIIGDAGYSRYYKNGLESAFNSAKIAVKVVFEHGVSEQAFEKYYYPLCKEMFIKDNFYGRMLFKLNNIISSHEILSIAHMDIAIKDERKGHRHLDEIQWNMFTGHDSYRNIFWKFFNPKLQLELGIETLKEIMERLSKKCRLR